MIVSVEKRKRICILLMSDSRVKSVTTMVDCMLALKSHSISFIADQIVAKAKMMKRTTMMGSITGRSLCDVNIRDAPRPTGICPVVIRRKIDNPHP